MDLFSDSSVPVPRELREEISKEVSEFVKEQVLQSIAESKSPISGGKFKSKLTTAYAAKKMKDGAAPVANLELTGEMLDSLDTKITNKGFDIGVYGSAAPRADGHNNFSGDSKLPPRQFLPKAGEKFKSDIQAEIDKIIKDKVMEQVEVGRRTFATIRTADELFAVLDELYPDLSRRDIKEGITRNLELSDLLDEFNLLRFLDGR